MNRSLPRLPLLGLLLALAVSCGVEEYTSPELGPHTENQHIGEGRTPPPVLDTGGPMRSVDSTPSGIERWKYGYPARTIGNDVGPTTVDACWFTISAHSVILARVRNEPTADFTTCPSPYRDTWQPLHLDVLEVLAGYPVPAELLTASLTAPHGRIAQGELRLISLRRTEREWYPIKSIKLNEELSADYPTAVTPAHVLLPEDRATLRAQLSPALDHYDDPEVCPERSPWSSDAEFAEWLYAPAEHCAEPFVDPLQEP